MNGPTTCINRKRGHFSIAHLDRLEILIEIDSILQSPFRSLCTSIISWLCHNTANFKMLIMSCIFLLAGYSVEITCSYNYVPYMYMYNVSEVWMPTKCIAIVSFTSSGKANANRLFIHFLSLPPSLPLSLLPSLPPSLPLSYTSIVDRFYNWQRHPHCRLILE